MLSQYGDGDTQLRLRLEKLEQIRKVLQDGGKWTPELQAAFDKASIDIAKQTDTIQGAYYRTFDNIGEKFTDVFSKMVETGSLKFSDLAKAMKQATTPITPSINLPLVKEAISS